jgi:hypothetical protein
MKKVLKIPQTGDMLAGAVIPLKRSDMLQRRPHIVSAIVGFASYAAIAGGWRNW